MDLLYEQELTAEVIFLHSLWHQGPPRPPAADHNHHHLNPVQATEFLLNPVQASEFKKVRKPRKRKKSTQITEPNLSPDLPWPVPPPPPPTDACSTFESKPYPNPKKLSSKERSELAAENAHHNALRFLAAFFRSNNNTNSDSDSDSHPDSIDSISDEDDDSIDEDKCGFFDKTFEEDTKMRDYYKKSFAKGEFSCVVCGSLEGKKTRKKFKGCVALVQHSISITKTKRMKAHRAFGKAVCKVLGWDITNLSSIDSSLSKEADSVGNKGISNDEAVPEIGLIASKILPNCDGDNNCNDADKRLDGVEAVQDLEEPSAAHGLTNEVSHQDSENAG